jgi:hypothetical protein
LVLMTMTTPHTPPIGTPVQFQRSPAHNPETGKVFARIPTKGLVELRDEAGRIVTTGFGTPAQIHASELTLIERTSA